MERRRGILAKSRIAACYAVYAAANAVFIIAAFALYAAKSLGAEWAGRAANGLLRFLVRLLALRVFPALGGCRVRAEGFESLPPAPSVYAFNHISHLDPLFAIALVPNAAVVVKGKYDSVMSIWVLTRLFDFVSLGGGSRAELEGAMEKLSRVVGLGRNIVIFPEGTRMSGGRLGDFKSMAFRLSRRFVMDVVPGAIVSSEPVLARGASIIPDRNGFSFSIRLLAPLRPGDFDSADSLSAAAYRAISRACKDMRASFPEKNLNARNGVG